MFLQAIVCLFHLSGFMNVVSPVFIKYEYIINIHKKRLVVHEH